MNMQPDNSGTAPPWQSVRDALLPYARQSVNEADLHAVMETLKGDWITQGPVVERFERCVAEYCGAKYGVAVSNGTAALHLACMALDLKEGDWLWTTPNTFVASANCGRYCGASVDFVDIDPRTYNMSAELLAQKLAVAERAGKLPKVVVPVHFSGQPADMAPIHDLSRRYGFSVIEDGAHALGAQYQGKPVGDGRYSDFTTLSFHPVKIITTAEGGMILTNDRARYKRLMRLRSHGITTEQEYMEEQAHGPWYYEMNELAFNFRMTEMQAALGLSQMDRLDSFLHRRRELAARYDSLLKGLPLTLPWQHPAGLSSWHLYVIRLKLDKISKTHRQVFDEVRAAGVKTNIHYIPVHTQPYYRKLGFKRGDFPEAEKYYSEVFSLPLFPGLTDEDQERFVGILRRVLA